MTLRIGILASHEGTGLQRVLDACASDTIAGEVRVVVSNNRGAKALARAARSGIEATVLNRTTHPDAEARDAAIADTLRSHSVEVVCLAGYMKLIGPRTLAAFPNRILNVHPALLPRFGGQGMYGLRVHEAVLASGEGTTGATVHLIDERYDHGPTVAQQDGVPVHPGDTPASLAERVRPVEHELLVRTLARIALDEIDLDAVGVGTAT